MSDLRRWFEEGASADEQRLLDAARRERPDPAARLRTLAALGLSGPPGGTPSGGAPAAGAGRTGALVKVALASMTGALVIGGGLWLTHPGHAPKTGSMSTASTPAAVSLTPAAPQAPNGDSSSAAAIRTAGVQTAVIPSTTPSSHAPATSALRDRARSKPRGDLMALAADQALAPHPASPAASSPPSLAAEVAALDRAQARLTAGDPAGALGALERYRAEFPAGRLTAEETVLHVRALLAADDAARAAAVADDFAALHPGSSYNARLRDLIHDARTVQKN